MRKVNAKLIPFLDQLNESMAAQAAQGFKFSVINSREMSGKMIRSYISDIPEVDCIFDEVVYSTGYNVPVRVYNPAPEKKLPVLLYFHGGGHVVGSVENYDPICRKFSLATQHILVAPEYRLAPENPYPAAVVDSCAVARGIWTVLDKRKVNYQTSLSVAGDSAGGALSASVSHLAQYDLGITISKQVLVYPCVDYTARCASYKENGVGYYVERDKCIWFSEQYFKDGQCRKSASPLHMDFSGGLPDTLVITAGFCPLRDEGVLYYKSIKNTGVRSENFHFPDMIHGFLNMEDLVRDECQETYFQAGKFLNG
ncbi:alpha/beta hydrolase [Microbulbifer sp. VTAC004]|uniref:alpha/beta hydrolase n=1 Tax=Microbulbifer sp. VTAC004 TaxID=3243386 RepID=UPI004039B82C